LDAGVQGGSAPVVLSSSNEEAVRAFLEKRISFMSIPRVVSHVLRKHTFEKKPSLKSILSLDQWARAAAVHVIQQLEK
jgi:1-deoxy-D-xylulose-5-phosphate reductoisomerase